MADERPPGRTSAGSVGSVAEEMTRLLDAMFGGEPPSPQAPPRPGPSTQPDGQRGPEPEPEREPEREPEQAGHSGTRHTQVCGSCGQRVGAAKEGEQTPSVCHLCPVCQLISAVRSVRPETVERLADLAAAFTQTLREVAATRWAETGKPGAERHRSTVEDIDVQDDQLDEDGDLDDVDRDPDDDPDDDDRVDHKGDHTDKETDR